jgi:signal transduction histidine kinase
VASDHIKSIVIAPIEFADAYYGNLIIGHEKPASFGLSDINLVEGLATQLAVTLKRLEIVKTVRKTEKLNRDMEVLSEVGKAAMGFSHDLSNDLAPIQLYTRTIFNIVKKNLSPKAKAVSEVQKAKAISQVERALKNINERMKKAGDSTQTLKRTIKYKQKKLLESEVISVNMLLDEIGLILDRSQKVELTLGAESNIGAIEVNSTLMKEALKHLISNAVEAMEGRGSITIRAYREPPDVIITVSDTGPGIKSSLLEKIFELRFSTKGSTGYGLWRARDTIESYTGTLTVESKLGHGATFIIRLPLTNRKVSLNDEPDPDK